MNELVPYTKFATLRLNHFVSSQLIQETSDWEWMDGFWISESIGFTNFCRLQKQPDELGGLEIDFREISSETIEAIFNGLGLHLRPRMQLADVEGLIGEPTRTLAFVEDRASYDFQVGERDRYLLRATIHQNDGLIHVAIIRDDVLARIRSENN